jgi:phage shock protein E
MKLLALALLVALSLGCGASADDATAGAPDAAILAETGSSPSDAASPSVCDCAVAADVVSVVDARVDIALTDAQAPKDAGTSEEDAAAPPKDTGGAPQDTGSPLDAAPPTLCELTPAQLHDALANKDFLLIDVHTPFAGTIPGTDARILYTDIAGLVAFIGSDLRTKVVLTCHSGGMSTSAGTALVSRGYRAVCELSGGMMAWTNAGYTLDMDGG